VTPAGTVQIWTAPVLKNAATPGGTALGALGGGYVMMIWPLPYVQPWKSWMFVAEDVS